MSRSILRLLAPLTLTLALLAPRDAAAKDWWESLGMTTILSGSSGIDPVNPYLASTLSLQPSWKITSDLRLGGRVDVEREHTNDDLNDELHEYIWTDILLTLTHARLAEIGDWVTFGGFGRVYVPTSEASELNGLQTAVRLGAKASTTLGPVTLAFRPYVHKNFHASPTPSLEAPGSSSEHARGRMARPLVTPGDVRDLAFLPLPPEMQTVPNQMSSWAILWAFDLDWQATSSLSLGVSWTLLNYRSYDVQPFSCADHPNVTPCDDSGGDLAHVPGMDNRMRPFQLFQAGITYSFSNELSLAMSYVNWPLPQSTNGMTYRHPYVFYQDGNNFTTVGIDLTYAL